MKLAILTTLILLVVSTPLAWWLSRGRSWIHSTVAAVVSLPLVLPPTVLGFYLLVFFGPKGWGGQVTELIGVRLPFSFAGLLVGSLLYSLPFVVQPLTNSFRALGERPLEIAASLGAGPWDRFWSVIFPLTRPGYMTALILGFAHTVGEFGVILMIGGNIPGETRVLSIEIFDAVESLRWDEAHGIAGGMLIISFLLLLILQIASRRERRLN